jgi:hypothetical protein
MTDDDAARRRRADAITRAAFQEPARTAEQALSEATLFGDDPAQDLALLVGIFLSEGVIPPRSRPAAERAHRDASVGNAVALAVSLERAAAAARDPHETVRVQGLADRVRVSAALLGDTVSCLYASHRAGRLARANWDSPDHARALYTGQAEFALRAERNPRAGHARGKVRTLAAEESRAAAAVVLRSAAGPVRDDTGMDPRDEDYDGPWADDADGRERRTVLAGIGDQSTATAVKEAKGMLGRIAGRAVPLVASPANLRVIEAALIREAPHFAALIREALSILTRRHSVGGPPLVAVGPPGSGKSRAMRRMAEALSLPVTAFNADASTDSSFCGTPRRWSSAEPAVPTAAMAASGLANPAILVDELDKAGGATHGVGGRLFDGLHGLWSPETSTRWRDPVAQADVDLSHVVYLCTANSLAGIPRSLLDRARVLQAPLPGPEHLAALAPRVAAEVAAGLGLHPAEAALDRDELAALALHWPGGSLRRLQRLCEAVLTARPASAPRH